MVDRSPGRVFGSRAVAAALSLCLSSIFCLLGCASVSAAKAGAGCSTSTVPDQHACCKASKAKAKAKAKKVDDALGTIGLPSRPAGRSPASCCALGKTAGIAEPSPSANDPFARVADGGLAAALALSERSPAPRPATVRLANRGDTYLRCCVFLI